jgi:hypothetical protein
MFNIEFAKIEDQFDYDCFEEIEYLSFDFCILGKQREFLARKALRCL